MHAATDDPDVNAAVVDESERRHIFCVRADAGSEGTAVTPASFEYEGLAVGVLAAGDHRRSAAIRSAIHEAFQQGLIAGDAPGVVHGGVALVGGGPGDPELITVRGRRLLANADVVVADRLAPPELLAELPPHVENRVIGSNRLALDAAAREAESRGYRVFDLGAFVEGETAAVATTVAGVVRSIRRDGKPLAPPACVLIGGETTVTLGDHLGKGGRNQEFVLALLTKLAATPEALAGVTVLSGGTDGEDGPTDAAGAVADADTLTRAAASGLSVADHLQRHDAYPFFAATGDLLKPGLTGTNVMDVRVVLVR